jgi:4-hydroxy-2-oxoheptanedioate aldolase
VTLPSLELPVNRFRRAITGGGPCQIGLWSSLADPLAAELLATTGFDWILLDGEHAPNDLRTLVGQLQSTPGTDIVVRPPVGDPVHVKRLLDIGAQTLLIPMVDTADHAGELARAVEFPPTGIRGVASTTRAGRWGAIPDYLTRARTEICLILQIETRAAVENIDEIAAVEGIDALFVGPSDLAASLGHLGEPGAAEVVEVVEFVAARAHAAGKPVGILSMDERQAAHYVDSGFEFVAVGMDTSLLRRAALTLRSRFVVDPT